MSITLPSSCFLRGLLGSGAARLALASGPDPAERHVNRQQGVQRAPVFVAKAVQMGDKLPQLGLDLAERRGLYDFVGGALDVAPDVWRRFAAIEAVIGAAERSVAVLVAWLRQRQNGATGAPPARPLGRVCRPGSTG
jgi:hypothetical protein